MQPNRARLVRPRTATSLLSCALLLAIAACGGDDEAATGSSKPAVPISAADRQEADTKFKVLCATCHGESGKGDGPGAVALNPKPRNYTDANWQKTVTDEELRKIIVQGGQAVGKSPLMPPNPDLQTKPGVVEALVQKVRSFAK
jgi:hypothetical protein